MTKTDPGCNLPESCAAVEARQEAPVYPIPSELEA